MRNGIRDDETALVICAGEILEMIMGFDLTEEEKKAIRALKRVAKIWPDSLCLFSGGGTLVILKTDENGGQIMDERGCIDQDYIVTTVNISNDGGDW